MILDRNMSSYPTCAGCSKVIEEKYLLKAAGLVWHERCLCCSHCRGPLAELGPTLFVKRNLLLCKTDYYRLFGVNGKCSACLKTVSALEMVMKAKDHIYHIDCFACLQCRQRLKPGDRFCLIGNELYCEKHQTGPGTN